MRSECGSKLGLKDNSKAAWCWIVDFPMYGFSEIENGRIDFEHNPFSMVQGGKKALAEKNPLDILAYQFDMIVNGFEASSGAIRNHDPELMYQAFEIAGYDKAAVEARFGALIKAFKFGAPPHGGFAFGIDRLAAILAGEENIREVIAFPKTQSGSDPMTNAPTPVDPSHLADLGLRLLPPPASS